MDVGILGAGSWGLALSSVLLDNGHKVSIWHYKKKISNNKKKIFFTTDLTAFYNKDILLIALPSHSIQKVLTSLNVSKNTIVVNCSKGFDFKSEKTLSSLIINSLSININQFVTLSGPSHAEEVLNKIPTAIVSASISEKNTKIIQKEFSNNYFSS